MPEPLISKPNMDMPEPLTQKPNMDMPRPSPKAPIVQNKNSNPIINLTGNNRSIKAQTDQMQQEVKPMNISGKWSIKLSDNIDSSMDIDLWSSGAIIMGFGTLTEGYTKNSITAMGYVDAQKFALTVKSAVPNYDREYDLHLFIVNNSLSGTYIKKSGKQSLGKGNATANRKQ
jgi:hypothetical protein